jgi:hypothetical protein
MRNSKSLTMLFGRSLTIAASVLASASLLAACENSPESERGRQSPRQRAESASRADGGAAQDPCTLLSAQEAEPYVGALAIAPFRASDGSDTPDAGGDACVYRGIDGKHFTVLADWRGGGMMGEALDGLHESVGGVAGPWDKAMWTDGGALFVYKGDAQIRIDMSAAGGQKNDALALAREIVPRIGHPQSSSRSK